MSAVVTTYVRPGCHLCTEALAVLERVRAAHTFSLHVVNIEDDDALHEPTGPS